MNTNVDYNAGMIIGAWIVVLVVAFTDGEPVWAAVGVTIASLFFIAINKWQ